MFQCVLHPDPMVFPLWECLIDMYDRAQEMTALCLFVKAGEPKLIIEFPSLDGCLMPQFVPHGMVAACAHESRKDIGYRMILFVFQSRAHAEKMLIRRCGIIGKSPVAVELDIAKALHGFKGGLHIFIIQIILPIQSTIPVDGSGMIEHNPCCEAPVIALVSGGK